MDCLSPNRQASMVDGEGSNKVLIVGAGTTGLALAQGLKEAGIPYVVYERDVNAIAKRSWSMGLQWAVRALQYLIPEELVAWIQSTQVDPNTPTKDTDQISFINGQMGEAISEIKSDKVYRFRRDKIRALLLEGIEVRCKKTITDIVYSADGKKITAQFTDGTEDAGCLVIASDSPHSTVRTLLAGSEKAKVTPIDLATTMCYSKHSRGGASFCEEG